MTAELMTAELTTHRCADEQADLPPRGLLLSSRHGETLASSCAATREHISTAFGLHAGSESVGSFTTLIVWLECTLHDNCLRLRRAQIDIRCNALRQAETRNMVNPEADISFFAISDARTEKTNLPRWKKARHDWQAIAFLVRDLPNSLRRPLPNWTSSRGAKIVPRE